MPYTLQKQPSGKVAIINKDKQKVVGHSNSRDMAMRAIAARYAAENKK